jgi:hypothetical protein
MYKKLLAIILIIIGGYLLVGNPILSMIFTNVEPIGFDVPINPVNYATSWFLLYGPITILLAGIGVLLVIYGFSMLKRSHVIIREIE